MVLLELRSYSNTPVCGRLSSRSDQNILSIILDSLYVYPYVLYTLYHTSTGIYLFIYAFVYLSIHSFIYFLLWQKQSWFLEFVCLESTEREG